MAGLIPAISLYGHRAIVIGVTGTSPVTAMTPSVEIETLLAHEGAEVRALRVGVLPCLVL